MTPPTAYVAWPSGGATSPTGRSCWHQEIAHVAAQHRVGLIARVAHRPDLERQLPAGAAADARLARAPRAWIRRCRPGCARPRAPCAARSETGSCRRPAPFRARRGGREPERAHRRRAHRRVRILERRRSATAPTVPGAACRGSARPRRGPCTRDRESASPRLFDLGRLRARRRAASASIATDSSATSGRRGEDACKACSGSLGRATAVNGKTKIPHRRHSARKAASHVRRE